jgi:hypothetical protein
VQHLRIGCCSRKGRRGLLPAHFVVEFDLGLKRK